MTLNQQIVDQLKNKLESIEGIQKVFEWLSRPLNDGEYPALILRDPTDKVKSDFSSGVEDHTLLVEIDVIVSPDDYEAVQLRELVPKVKGAVRDAISQDDFFYYGKYLGRTIVGEHKEYFYVASRLSFEIQYETEKWSEE
jgi:hypothetical protein